MPRNTLFGFSCWNATSLCWLQVTGAAPSLLPCVSHRLVLLSRAAPARGLCQWCSVPLPPVPCVCMLLALQRHWIGRCKGWTGFARMPQARYNPFWETSPSCRLNRPVGRMGHLEDIGKGRPETSWKWLLGLCHSTRKRETLAVSVPPIFLHVRSSPSSVWSFVVWAGKANVPAGAARGSPPWRKGHSRTQNTQSLPRHVSSLCSHFHQPALTLLELRSPWFQLPLE